jgi:hypothetical protein
VSHRWIEGRRWREVGTVAAPVGGVELMMDLAWIGFLWRQGTVEAGGPRDDLDKSRPRVFILLQLGVYPRWEARFSRTFYYLDPF